ncbi:MAG: FkbM family methyltransferase [Cyanobacteria bacterium SIG28]|nr:FkbM family methyltransferase [Cyanobacteria bacterium SIG28]
MAKNKQKELLAFDIGAYTGDTTDKLLEMYDKVICVDANPNMIKILKEKYTKAPVEIIEGCISNLTTDVNFYISTNDAWCSSKKEIAERVHKSQTIQTKPLNIVNIIDKYGCPYYLKCDIEGADITLLRQLSKSQYRPVYISCESECIGSRDINLSADEDLEILNEMKNLGYSKFVLINQRNNIINESNYLLRNYNFNILNKFWLTYDEIKTLMRSIDRNHYPIFNYWFDIIATLN